MRLVWYICSTQNHFQIRAVPISDFYYTFILSKSIYSNYIIIIVIEFLGKKLIYQIIF